MGTYRFKSKFSAVVVLLFSLVIIGGGVYYYYSKYKEPTHGVFVYEDGYIKDGALDCGYIY